MENGVSILVILELALEVHYCATVNESTVVSILVILELALEEHRRMTTSMVHRSFNPCYSGIGFRSFNRTRMATYRSGFNPCYSGIGFRSAEHFSGITEVIVFQSLLFWNWL